MPLPLIALQGKLPTRLAEPQLSPVAVGETLEFGRFKVLLRRRELLSEAVPIELGARAFDLLLILLEADGALVTKEELLSRAWLGMAVSEENLKVQISALRKALLEGLFDVFGSDHAPHTLQEKALPYPQSPSGMPGVQTMLPVLLRDRRATTASATTTTNPPTIAAWAIRKLVAACEIAI